MSQLILNLNEAAVYLHLSQRDMEHLVRRMEIPFERAGTRPLFHKKDIDAWASRRILGMPEKNLQAYHRDSARAHDVSQRHAIVTELLRPEQCRLDLAARTKPSLLRAMVSLAEQTELLYSAAELLSSLEERESLCSTALSDGIALLHPRNHDPYMFEDSFIIISRTAQALPFGAPDGEHTDVFFLICCQDDRLHLHVLARICVMCRRTRLIDDIRRASDVQAMIQALVDAEQAVIGGK